MSRMPHIVVEATTRHWYTLWLYQHKHTFVLHPPPNVTYAEIQAIRDEANEIAPGCARIVY